MRSTFQKSRRLGNSSTPPKVNFFPVYSEFFQFFFQPGAVLILISQFQWEAALEMLLQNSQFEKAALLMSSCKNFKIPVSDDILLYTNVEITIRFLEGEKRENYKKISPIKVKFFK